MMTDPERAAAIQAIVTTWRAVTDQRIAMDWAPEFAFDDAANRAAKIGKRDEATIQMMTSAAGWIAYPPSREPEWPHKEAFRAWWNARFPDCPRLDDYDFAAPCLAQIGDHTAAIISTWSAFTREFSPERAQA